MSTQGRSSCCGRRRGTNLVELLVFFVLLAVSIAVSGWLAPQLGLPGWVLVGPAFVGAFYALRGIVTGLQIRGDSSLSYESRGHVHIARAQYQGAIEDFTQALAKAPDGPARIYFWRGLAHLGLRDYDRALADLDQALALEPDGYFAHFHRGQVHRSRGEHEAAVADFDRVVALVPQHAEAYLQRALVRGELGQYREALADLEVCLTLERAPAEARYQQAVMHEHLGETGEAKMAYRAFLRAARRRDPNAPRARARLEELGGD